MWRAARVHVYGRALFRQSPGRAGVIEVDVTEEEMPHVIRREADRFHPCDNVLEGGFRAAIEEGEAVVRFEHRGGDDLGALELKGVDDMDHGGREILSTNAGGAIPIGGWLADRREIPHPEGMRSAGTLHARHAATGAAQAAGCGHTSLSFEDLVDTLKRAGLRMTDNRRAILRALLAARSPLSLEEIREHSAHHGGVPDFATVFRTMEQLEVLATRAARQPRPSHQPF